MPPANIVRPAIAEAGSISGAWVLVGCDGPEGCENGMQTGGSQDGNGMQILEFPSEADATPVAVIKASAKPIFRITLKSSKETRREHERYYRRCRRLATRGLLNTELYSAFKYNMLSNSGFMAYQSCHWFHPRTLTAISAFVVA